MVQMGFLRPKIGNAFHMARKSLQLIGERSAIKVIDLRVHPHDPFNRNIIMSSFFKWLARVLTPASSYESFLSHATDLADLERRERLWMSNRQHSLSNWH